jgi:hypothetical protein
MATVKQLFFQQLSDDFPGPCGCRGAVEGVVAGPMPADI